MFVMTDTLRVILEVGKKRRVVAGAMDWPGLDRWGTSEDDAVEKLLVLPSRGTPTSPNGRAWRARSRGHATSRSSSASPDRARPTSGASPTCRRRSRARSSRRPTSNGGSTSCARAGPTSTTSRRASRASSAPDRAAAGAAASRSSATCTLNEPDQFSRKVEVRTPLDVVLTPDGLAAHRQAYLDAIRAYNAEGKPARTWPIQFLVRRTAHHVMDHAWEMEDRDPAA